MKKSVKVIGFLMVLVTGVVFLAGCATAPEAVISGVSIPSVQVNPGQVTAAAGQAVTITGAGFDADSPVAILIEFGGSLNDISSYTSGGIVTNGEGAFSAKWGMVAGAVKFLETKTYSVAVTVGDDTVYAPLDVAKP